MTQRASQQLYRVVLTGRQLIDDVNKIKADVQSIFDLPEAQLNALVSGKALTIKKDILAPNAMKFKKALTRCGLECMVEPMNEDSILNAEDLYSQRAQATPSSNTQPAARKPSTPERSPLESLPAESTPVAAQLNVAPAGARIGPRPGIEKHDLPNVDHLEAGFAERLAPEAKEVPPPPNVDHIDVAEHDRLSPETEEGPAPPNVDHIDVAEHDRLSPELEDAPLPPSVDHLDMAPAGATLGEAKKTKALELDLSHLDLKHDESHDQAG